MTRATVTASYKWDDTNLLAVGVTMREGVRTSRSRRDPTPTFWCGTFTLLVDR